MNRLRRAGSIVVFDEFCRHAPDVVLAEEHEVVEGIFAQSSIKPLYVSVCVGGPVRDRNAFDSHHIVEPTVEMAAVRPLPSIGSLDCRSLAVLAEDAVVVMNQKPRRLAPRCGVSDLQLDPRQGRRCRELPMNDTARFDLHDDENVNDCEESRVLGEEIAGP